MPQLVNVKCQSCGKEWKEVKRWYGQSEVCGDCVQERIRKNNCKRHGGRDGKDCSMCKLEAKF